MRPFSRRALVLITGAFVLVTSQSAMATDQRPEGPFTDLPGVKAEEKKPTSNWTSDCTSEIRRQRWDEDWDDIPSETGLGRRVYTCQNGPVTFESTKPSMEYDWDVYKQRN